MMPASKHGDPQLGVDIRLCVVPPSPSPVPLPTPHISVVFDPFDYIPYIGATVTVCGMKRATAGTGGMVVHIPPGFPFAPKLPDKDDELFMGSSTVVADGDPFSYIALPVLGCQIVGMPSIPRLKKQDAAGDRLQTRIVDDDTSVTARQPGRDPSLLWSRQGASDGATYRFDRAGNLVYRRDRRGELVLRWDSNQRLIESRLGKSATH